jgi:hypothetical protein
MSEDLIQRHKAKAGKFKITGEDRGTPIFRPGHNTQYDWHEFKNGDYCTIPGTYREIWNSARTSAYMYGYRTGKTFKTSMGSHELIIWRQDNLPDDENILSKMMRRTHAFIDQRGDIASTATGEKLQGAANDDRAQRLLALYLISGATTPQNYELFDD